MATSRSDEVTLPISQTSNIQNAEVVQEVAEEEEDVQIKSFRDLHALCDCFKQDGITHLYSTFSFIDDEDHVYFGQSPIRRQLLGLHDLKKGLKRIPDENVYPEASSHITAVEELPRENIYIKRPKLTVYDEVGGTDFLQTLLLEEAKTFEFLKQHSHPGLVRYHGCRVKRGYLTGLVLERYPTTLELRMKERPEDLDIDSCIEGIEAGIQHLHSLGLAHNDLNPNNIMLDEDDNPVLIDFGSCKPFGENLMSAGTPGWIEEEYFTSKQRQDEFALKQIRAWLRGENRSNEV